MITLNEDRKQTKYGHKRRERKTHTTEDWHNSPSQNQEPSGAKQTGQDRQPKGTGSPPGLGLEAEASSGHDKESGALTGSLSNRFHLNDRRRVPWTRPTWQDKLKCSCGHNKTKNPWLRGYGTTLLAVMWTGSMESAGLSQRRAGGLAG